jgi:hypothetical protein
MYNTKDIQFVGKHDYDKDNSLHTSTWAKTFSVGIFQWVLKNNRKEMKRGKVLVRVSGPCSKSKQVFEMAEHVVIDLDNNEWDGRKNVLIK